MNANQIKNYIIHVSGSLLRIYIRYFPISFGKNFIWKRFLLPYVTWKKRTVLANTADDLKMELHLPDQVQGCIYYFGLWEINLTHYLKRSLKPGDILIDVGANVGYYTLLAAKQVGNDGKVYAVEASASAYKFLKRNIEINRLENVMSFHRAASDKDAELEIYSGETRANLGATTIRRNKAEKFRFKLEGTVKASPLDQIIPIDDLLRARIIKIDVEGAEISVIRGIEPILSQFSCETEFVIELTTAAIIEAGETVSGIVDIFKRNGFRPYQLVNDYSARPYLHRLPPVPPSVLKEINTDQVDVIFSKRDPNMITEPI